MTVKKFICKCCGIEFTMKATNAKYCLNCREKMYNQGHDEKREIKEQIIKELGGKCVDCGYELNNINFCAFHFHHLKDKKFELCNVNMKRKDLKEELAKCILVCANCHSIRHSKGGF